MINEVRKIYGEKKSIWLYTGYVLGDNIPNIVYITSYILKNIDVLVDGPFVEEKKNLSLRFKGSENQRIIDMRKTIENKEIYLWED